MCPESCEGLAGGSPVGVVAKQPRSWWPAVGEIRSSKRHDKVASGGEQATGPQHQANSAASSPLPGLGWEQGGSRASTTRVKAMEGVLILESAPMNPPAYGKWNGRIVVHGTGEIRLVPDTRWPSGCRPMVPGAGVTYKPRGEVVGCRAEVGGGRSSADGGDNTTLLERRASSRVCTERNARLRGLPSWLVTPPVTSSWRSWSSWPWWCLGWASTLVAERNAPDRLPGRKPDEGERASSTLSDHRVIGESDDVDGS